MNDLLTVRQAAGALGVNAQTVSELLCRLSPPWAPVVGRTRVLARKHLKDVRALLDARKGRAPAK